MYTVLYSLLHLLIEQIHVLRSFNYSSVSPSKSFDTVPLWWAIVQ